MRSLFCVIFRQKGCVTIVYELRQTDLNRSKQKQAEEL